MNDSLTTLKKSSKAVSARSRRPMPSWLIPAGIVLGFGLLFLLLFRDRIMPATRVEVGVVLSTEIGRDGSDPQKESLNKPSKADAYRGPTAFQASGWVEPDPLPTKATALIDGVVEQLHVLEGEDVSKGQLLATLIRDDTELRLRAATSKLRMREAALAAQDDAIAAASARRQAAKSVVTQTSDRHRRLEGLPKGALAETELTAIHSAWQNAVAAERAAAAELTRLRAQTEVLASEVGMAKVELDIAKLAHERTRISSPIDGRVLQLHAVPGKKKMLGMDGEDSATIAILYEPDKLQIRVDIPLADAGALQIGQLARIKCNLLPDITFHGEVTRIEGRADIARNTLQAKVRITDPSDRLRPEMLCRVEFLEGLRDQREAATSRGTLTTWAPKSAISSDSVWVVDPKSKRLEKRSVKTTNQSREGYQELSEGLKPGEWVVLSPGAKLKENQRVNPSLSKP